MTDESNGGNAAPLAPAESFTTPESAQQEYRRYMISPEYQAAARSPHGKGPATARLEALAKAAWPEPGGIQASPAPGSPEEAHKAASDHVDLVHKQGGAEPLTDVETQQMAAAFEPKNPNDYTHALPCEEHAELRQTLFDNAISKSMANVIAGGATLIKPVLELSDADYYSRVDKALADVRATPGGQATAAKAFALVDSQPEDSFWRPFGEYLLTLPGGVIELAHLADRLRAKAAAK